MMYNQVLGPTVCIAGSRVLTAHGNTVRRWDFWKYQVTVVMVIVMMGIVHIIHMICKLGCL